MRTRHSQAAVEMRKNGLHFIGMVKQSYKLFPRAYLTQDELYTDREDSVDRGQVKRLPTTGCGVEGFKDTEHHRNSGGHSTRTRPCGEAASMDGAWRQYLDGAPSAPRVVGEYLEGAKGVAIIIPGKAISPSSKGGAPTLGGNAFWPLSLGLS